MPWRSWSFYRNRLFGGEVSGDGNVVAEGGKEMKEAGEGDAHVEPKSIEEGGEVAASETTAAHQNNNSEADSQAGEVTT